jgi:hypothetical protein
MNSIEAYGELCNGKKIRHESWMPEDYVEYKDGKLVSSVGVVCNDALYFLEGYKEYINPNTVKIGSLNEGDVFKMPKSNLKHKVLMNHNNIVFYCTEGFKSVYFNPDDIDVIPV